MVRVANIVALLCINFWLQILTPERPEAQGAQMLVSSTVVNSNIHWFAKFYQYPFELKTARYMDQNTISYNKVVRYKYNPMTFIKPPISLTGLGRGHTLGVPKLQSWQMMKIINYKSLYVITNNNIDREGQSIIQILILHQLSWPGWIFT